MSGRSSRILIIIVDYYSRFIKIAKLDRTIAEAMIQRCKNIFSRHGIPEEIVRDNESQFDSNASRKFSKQYQFCHITSSPYYLRSNGEVERGVKTVNALPKKGDPLSKGYSLAELLMNRKLSC